MADGASEVERDKGFEALRGIAIICVVAIHSVNSGYKWKDAAEGAWNFWYSMAVRQSFNFAVPLFVFMAGYFLVKDFSKGGSRSQALAGRFRRVLFPYLFWSTAIMLGNAISRKEVELSDFLLRYLYGGAQGPYYFVILVMQFYLLAPLLVELDRRRWGLQAALAVNLVSLGVLTAARYGSGADIPLSWYALPFPLWIGYFQMGIFVATRPSMETSLKLRRKLIAVLALLALTLSWAEAYYALEVKNSVGWAASAVKGSSFLYALSAILLLMSIKPLLGRLSAGLAWLGGCSFGIFLIHDVYIKHSKALFRKVAAVQAFQPLSHAITILLALTFSVLTIYLARRFLPKKFNRDWLGFL